MLTVMYYTPGDLIELTHPMYDVSETLFVTGTKFFVVSVCVRFDQYTELTLLTYGETSETVTTIQFSELYAKNTTVLLSL